MMSTWAPPVLGFPNLPRHVDAVHVGKPAVEKDRVVVAGLESGNRLPAILRPVAVRYAHPGEHRGKCPRVVIHILHDQDLPDLE